MEFDYTIEAPKGFESAVKGVEENTAKAGFCMFCVHDIQKIAEKNF